MFAFTDYEGLGLIAAIEVASIDIIVFMYMYAGMSRGPFEESMMSLLGRLLIFALGEEGWFWGYSATYFIFSMMTFLHLIN
mmetsp:Transcript_7891/g.1038  ORF Transcript_7891/g.1038 Transcript_7891/m.1038 type:complete len:81 (+) Transcript_7891:1762-2004(+)